MDKRGEKRERIYIGKFTPSVVAPTPDGNANYLDRKYEYDVVVHSEGIDIVLVVRGVTKGFPFTNTEASGSAKKFIVIRRLRIKSVRRAVLTSHMDPEYFDRKHPTEMFLSRN